MEKKRIERQDEAIESHLFLFEGYKSSEESKELNGHQEVDWIWEQNKTREDEVGLAKIPLFCDIDCQ